MNGRISRITGLAAAAVLALAAVAPVAAAEHEAMVRVLHASPDAPAVDVFLDGEKVDALTNVPFGTLSDYLAVPAGEHTVKVCATGDESTCPIDTTVMLDGGTKYTVAATNQLASIEAQVLVDDPNPTDAGALVRVVHFAADAPAVDVAPDGGDAIVEGLEYPNATGYLELPGGEYDLEVRPAGTSDVALDLDPLTLEDGTAYSVFAIGSAAGAEGSEPLQAVVGVDGAAAPATDTVGGAAGTIVPAALLMALGALAFAGGLRLATVRAQR